MITKLAGRSGVIELNVKRLSSFPSLSHSLSLYVEVFLSLYTYILSIIPLPVVRCHTGLFGDLRHRSLFAAPL